MSETTTDFLRTLLPDEESAILGIPVRRVGLLWFELDADCSPGMHTLDEATYALDYMTTAPRAMLPVCPAIVSVVGEVATALLLGRTITVVGPRSSCTVGPVLDADGAGIGWACVDFEGEVVPTVERWDECDEYGYAHTFGQADPSPFGVAMAFVRTVGGAMAQAALPGMVVPWYCQAAVDHGHPAAALPQEAPGAGEATEAQGPTGDAPTGQGDEQAAQVQLEDRAAAEATAEDMEPAAPIRIVWTAATAERGDAVHVVAGERVEIGRWAREPGQALCKPRGMRLKAATGAPSCKGCLGEAEKRNITL